MTALLKFREGVLSEFGASSAEIEELLSYNQNLFDWTKLPSSLEFPLADEAHIEVWQEYSTAAREHGVFTELCQRFPQLRFPIQKGMSQAEDYRAATLRCCALEVLASASGLRLQQPDLLELWLHRSLAGTIPVLFTPHRPDFVLLVQALSKRNELVAIPASMGACMVSGFNNCNRIHRYRQQWEEAHPGHCSNADWAKEFRDLIPQKVRYQDRFILLSEGAYSNVAADVLELDEAEWRSLSRQIRLEHECTHYLTWRLFEMTRNNALDELIADYFGMISAIGQFRADWFLQFMGLERFPKYREEGRLGNYRGNPSLSEGSFRILQALLKAAAEQIESMLQDFHEQRDVFSGVTSKYPLLGGVPAGQGGSECNTLTNPPLAIPRGDLKPYMPPLIDNIQLLLGVGLMKLTLEELASPEASDRLLEAMSIAQITLEGNSESLSLRQSEVSLLK
jgi:hypothetical protein